MTTIVFIANHPILNTFDWELEASLDCTQQKWTFDQTDSEIIVNLFESAAGIEIHALTFRVQIEFTRFSPRGSFASFQI
jgi:hypothetical protein